MSYLSAQVGPAARIQIHVCFPLESGWTRPVRRHIKCETSHTARLPLVNQRLNARERSTRAHGME